MIIKLYGRKRILKSKIFPQSQTNFGNHNILQNKNISPLFENMFHEIDDLIANFESKFDSEFGSPLPITTTNSQIIIHNSEQNEERQSLNEKKKYNNKSQTSSTVERFSKQKNSANHEQELEKEIKQVKESKQEKEQKQQKQQKEQKEEKEQNQYWALTNKLEKALWKISSSRKVQSQTGTHDLLARFDTYQKRRQKQLAIKRDMEEQKQYDGVRDKPQINKKSEKIAGELHQKPIHLRYQSLVEEKKRKQYENEEQKRKKEEKQYQQFVEEYKSHQRPIENRRNSEKYYDEMIMWKKKIEDKREEQVLEKEIKELYGHTFTPEINKRSEMMVAKTGRVPVEKREIEGVKRVVEANLTFHPDLRKKKIKW